MKKLLFVLGCFISVLSTAQEIEKPYDFPVKPGTEEWVKLKSSQEMDEVCVIPDEVLKNLSTRALLVTCMNYPRILDFFLVDNMQAGFDFYTKHFNGLAELIKRADLNQILISYYIDIDLPNGRGLKDDIKLSYLQIAFFELLISQEPIINNYTKSERNILLSEAIKKLEQRQLIGESSYRQRTSALILSRILNSENKLTSEYDSNGNDIAKIFNSTVFLTDSTLIGKLIAASKNLY